ncbi:MAG TPA: single-stranded DNA-binding protein [Longimicrobiales bacterium]
MSRSLNKVMLIGNVGSEPEVRTTPSGLKVAKVSLATNRKFNDRSGQQQEKTEWHRLTFWDKLAELVEQYVHKGDRLYVDGRLEYSQTEDDKGNVRYWTDVVVQDMVMLGGQAGGGGGGGGADFDEARPARQQQPRRQSAPQPSRQPYGGGRPQQPEPPASAFQEEDDDLPF